MRALLPIAMIATLSACPSKSVPVADTSPAPAPAPATPEPDTAAPAPADEDPATDEAPAAPAPEAKTLTDAQKAELVEAAATFKRLLNEGRKRVKAGAFAEGVAKYKAALALNPTNASVLGELGFAALGQGDLDRAEEWTRRAIAYSRGGRQLGALQYNLGQIFEKRDLPGDALVAYRASLAARPGNATVAGRVAALEAREDAKTRPTRSYDSLAALAGAQVLACLDYVGVWDEGFEAPRDVTPEAAEAGLGPCSVKVTQRVMAHGDNAPIREVAVIEAGTDLYTTVDLGVNVGGRWFVAQRLFENENSGCCGAYRDFTMTELELRDLVPGGGDEVTFQTTWEDQDSDMGINQIYHQSYASKVVCGADAGGGWCRELHTRELSYDGDLEKFLDDVGVKPRCWDVDFDGHGGYTRRSTTCPSDGPIAKAKAAERGKLVELPPL